MTSNYLPQVAEWLNKIVDFASFPIYVIIQGILMLSIGP